MCTYIYIYIYIYTPSIPRSMATYLCTAASTQYTFMNHHVPTTTYPHTPRRHDRQPYLPACPPILLRIAPCAPP